MKRIITVLILITIISPGFAKQDSVKDSLKNSLVYLDIYTHDYDTYRPWRHKDVSQSVGYAVAVGDDLILTTAQNVIDMSYIRVSRAGQNEYLTAEILVTDHELNLSLLKIKQQQDFRPLTPLVFVDCEKGSKLTSNWLSKTGQVETGRAYYDRASVVSSETSHTKHLQYIAASTSQETGWGELYCVDDKPVGIACWYSSSDKESGFIPAVAIERFLSQAKSEKYTGFGKRGFSTSKLVDPTRRKFLKLPEDVDDGVLVTKVWTLGTGCDVLKSDDVLVAVDDNPIDAFAKFDHPSYEQINYEHLITSKPIGDEIAFTIYRDGKRMTIDTTVKSFSAEQMTIPYYEYDAQPEFILVGGYLFQKLTRDYMTLYGDGWSGKVPPQLYNYYRNISFSPKPQRKDIVILSYVFPVDLSIGYHSFRQIIVDKINGKTITSINDVKDALAINPDSRFITIDLEQGYPTIVIDRTKLEAANKEVMQKYGVSQLENIR